MPSPFIAPTLAIRLPGTSTWIDYSDFLVIGQKGDVSLLGATGLSGVLTHVIQDTPVTKTWEVNQKPQLGFALGADLTDVPGFVKPPRWSEVRLDTQEYPGLFTGFVMNEPIAEVFGTNDIDDSNIFAYHYGCIGEEIILDLNLIGSATAALPGGSGVPQPYTNMYDGDIIAALIQLLAPGRFDTSALVGFGYINAIFQPLPQERFTACVSRLLANQSVKLWFRRGVAYIARYDDGTEYTADEDGDALINARDLSVSVVPTSIRNDVTGFGDNEPYEFVREYFLGDGFTGSWPLKVPVFRTSGNPLASDDFSQPLDSKWIILDPTSAFSILGGSLSVSGGTGLNLTYLQLAQGMEISRKHAIDGCEWRFVGAQDAIISGLYSAQTFTLVNCKYGFRLTPNGIQTDIQPIVNGALAGSKLTTVAGKSYAFRMYVDCQCGTRTWRPWWSKKNSFGGGTNTGTATITFVVEVTDTDQVRDATIIQLYQYEEPSPPGFLFLCLASVNNMSAAANFFAVTEPIQATLLVTDIDSPPIASDTFTGALGGNWGTNDHALHTVDDDFVAVSHDVDSTARWLPDVFGPDQYSRAQVTAVGLQDATGVCVRMDPSGGGSPFAPNETYYSFRVVPANGDVELWKTVAGTKTLLASEALLPAAGQYIELRAIGTKLTCLIGTQVVISATDSSIATGQPGIYGYWATATPQLPQATTASNWSAGQCIVGQRRKKIGFVGEQDADATISSSGSAYQLAFFQETIPEQGVPIELRYRGSRLSVARVIDSASIAEQATAFGDSGVRSDVLSSITPLPQTSEEVAAALQAYIDDSLESSFDGDWAYLLPPRELDAEPIPGRFIKVLSAGRLGDIGSFEEIVKVVQTDIIQKNDDGSCQYVHKLSYGAIVTKRTEAIMQRFEVKPIPAAVLAYNPSTQAPAAVDTSQVATQYCADLPDIAFVDFTSTQFNFDAGRNLAGNESIEVRWSDANWGQDGNNLVASFTTRLFSIDRLRNDQSIFVKLRTAAGSPVVYTLSRRPAFLRVVYPLPPQVLTVLSVDDSDPKHPIINLAMAPDQNLADLSALEVRAADNVTILASIPVNVASDLQFTYDNSVMPQTSVTLNFYAVNLLGEYSPELEVVIDLTTGQFAQEEILFGANLLLNPGFEIDSATYPVGMNPAASQYITDGWLASIQTGGWAHPPAVNYGVDSSLKRTGARSLRMKVQTGVTIPNGETLVGYTLNPNEFSAKGYQVRGGDTLRVGGYVQLATSGLPAGLTPRVLLTVLFMQANGTLTSLLATSVVAAVTSGWVYLEATAIVPDQAVVALVGASVQLANASGSPYVTTANDLDAHFDDILFEIANRGAHSSYRVLNPSNIAGFPLTGHDDTGGSPVVASATITVADFTLRSGNTDIAITGSAIHLLTNGLLYYVYCDIPAFVDSAPVFNATTVKEVALLGDNRFFIGSIVTPLVGGSDTIGNGDSGGGAQTGTVAAYQLGDVSTTVFGTGAKAIVNPNYALLNNVSSGSYAIMEVDGDGGGGSSSVLSVTLPPTIFSGRVKSLIIVATLKCVQNDLNGTGNRIPLGGGHGSGTESFAIKLQGYLPGVVNAGGSPTSTSIAGLFGFATVRTNADGTQDVFMDMNYSTLSATELANLVGLQVIFEVVSNATDTSGKCIVHVYGAKAIVTE